MRLAACAPAKINLSLHVGVPRADGLHPLDSLVAFAADAADRLWAEPAPNLSLTIDGPFAAPLVAEEDNLVLKAARALAEALGAEALGAALHLEKHLPIASGIGGGSADAAAALRLLNRLWGADLTPSALAQIAARVGADVPVCLACQPARMRGVGEHVDPIDLPDLAAVLVNPGVPAPTGAVYRAFDAAGSGSDLSGEDPPPRWSTSAQAVIALRRMRNDLTDAARQTAPEIGVVMEALASDRDASLVRLSGSGATVFAVTADPTSAAALAGRVKTGYPHWWVQPTRLRGVDGDPVSL